ncbi:armadillo-like helical domain containing protein 1 [Girardinichthys multiradiatus]|uniref:armadillo-like helical domain containing protein 1 n=1 Tax=Girardinichthys multiradiatus TaxID=208333 RepID=UPI001FAD8C30|nr:armadillo-like helical domain containing protein 1 [Girardinichthys multiradiatus]
MVNSFLGKNTGKSLYELEFADVASLFLARLTTWMRLTDQYLMEFLDDGGVLTLLVILSQSKTNEDDKAEAIHLLLTISNAGRKYKEFICEKHGVKIVAECMTMSNTNHTQETGRALMESLSYGNPTYQDQVYKSLIDLVARHQKPNKTERIEITGSLPEFLQQAAAAKTIRLVEEKDKELSEELLHLGVIQQLLHAMGNRKHTDSQIQASLALKVELLCSKAQPPVWEVLSLRVNTGPLRFTGQLENLRELHTLTKTRPSDVTFEIVSL